MPRIAPLRRNVATRSKRFWLGACAGVLALGGAAIALPLSAFAGDAPQLVSASGQTTTGDALSVTARCPSSKTAVSVTAEDRQCGTASERNYGTGVRAGPQFSRRGAEEQRRAAEDWLHQDALERRPF